MSLALPTDHQLRLLAADLARERMRLPRDYLDAPIPWGAWAELVSLLHGREAYRDEGEPPVPVDHEPGSPAKVRELTRRRRQRLSLFSPRDRQLPHAAAGAARALALAAEHLARLRRDDARRRLGLPALTEGQPC
jgi:hypothetical protein